MFWDAIFIVVSALGGTSWTVSATKEKDWYFKLLKMILATTCNVSFVGNFCILLIKSMSI